MAGNLRALTDKLKEVTESCPDRIAVQRKTDQGYTKYTHREFYETALTIARFLVSEGVKKGDRVAIVLENRPQWGFIYFGILFAGGIAVPIDIQSTAEDIKYLIDDSGSRIMFTSQEVLGEGKSLEVLSSLQRIVILECKESKGKVISFEEALSSAKDLKQKPPLPEVSPEDIASILYTSGTTGKPKGVMLTHGNFYANFLSVEALNLLSEKDNIISVLPLHHSYPFTTTLLSSLFLKAHIIYISALKSDVLLECMREKEITVLVGVPQLFYLFYKHISDELKAKPLPVRMIALGLIEVCGSIKKLTGINLGKVVLGKIHRVFGKRLRFFCSGGAKLNEEAARFLTKLGFKIIEGYGLTETAPVVSFNPLNAPKIGSVGIPLPGVEIKIVNPDSEGIGEVIIKGGNVMKGYYRLEEETRKVIREGWFYSGDLGYFDKDGYLFLVGREKELIVLSSGKNISPDEVESHYIKSLFIKELCVMAVGEGGEDRLAAVVVPDLDYYRKIGEVNVYGMIKWDLDQLSKKLPGYKRIMGFLVTTESFPRTRLGKLKRYEIKKKYRDALMGKGTEEAFAEVSLTDQDRQFLSSEVGKKVVQTVKKRTKVKRDILPDDHLELNLGIDSLGRTELMVALESAFKIHLPDSFLSKVFTVREIITEVEKLLLDEGRQEKEGVEVHSQEDLWGHFLQHKPSEDILHKITLFPTPTARTLTFLGCCLMRLFFKIFWRLKVYGRENIPKKGPFILCPNHGSYLDGFLLVASVPLGMSNDMHILGLRFYFGSSALRNVARFIHVIPMDIAERLVSSMQACSYILKHDKAMCVFPEGGRTIDGEVKEFKKGVGILAKELDVPLVPVYIKGSYEAWPRTERFPRMRPVRIIFGKPSGPRELKEKGSSQETGDDYEAIASGVREEVIELKDRIPE